MKDSHAILHNQRPWIVNTGGFARFVRSTGLESGDAITPSGMIKDELFNGMENLVNANAIDPTHFSNVILFI